MEYRYVKGQLLHMLSDISLKIWSDDVNRKHSKRGLGENKLRTYREFKQDLTPEKYVKIKMSKKYRRAFALFRSGTAPINIELKRFSSVYVPVDDRKCIVCNEVESECHVILECPLYVDIRDELLNSVITDHDHFSKLTDIEKLSYLFMSSHCSDVARACYEILDRRKLLTYF